MLLEIFPELLSRLASTEIPSSEYSIICDTYSARILEEIAKHDPKTIEIPLPILRMLVDFIATKVRYGMSANLNLLTGMFIRYIDAHNITDEQLIKTLLVALSHHRNLPLKDIIFAHGAAAFYEPVLIVLRDNIRHLTLQNRYMSQTIKKIGGFLRIAHSKSDPESIHKVKQLTAKREFLRARATHINNIIRLYGTQVTPVLEHALKMQNARLLRINPNDLIAFIATCGLMDYYSQLERAGILLYMVRLANTTAEHCSPSIHLAIEFLLLQTASKQDKIALLHYIGIEEHFRPGLKELFKQNLIARLPRDVPLALMFPTEVYTKLRSVFGISDPIVSARAPVILTQFSASTTSHSDSMVTQATGAYASQTQQKARLAAE